MSPVQTLVYLTPLVLLALAATVANDDDNDNFV
jgi:positive regulator of sigma E activity